MHCFDDGIAHRHLHEVAAVAAVGVAPVRTGTAGPQALVGLLDVGERIVLTAGVSIGHVGGHLYRRELIGKITVSQLTVVVGAPSMQGTGTVQCECMYISTEYLGDGFASETATRTRHGDVSLIAAAIAQLPVAVVSPRVQGAVILDGVMGGVTLPPGGNL